MLLVSVVLSVAIIICTIIMVKVTMLMRIEIGIDGHSWTFVDLFRDDDVSVFIQ